MKKKILGATLAAMMVLGLSNEALANNYDYDVKVRVNGEDVEFLDVKPFIDLDVGKTYVPVRFIAEKLDAEVDWVYDHVEIKKDGSNIKMWVNQSIIEINGKEVEVDAPAILIDGIRTMVPLKIVGDIFDVNVRFDGDDGVVIVDSVDVGDKDTVQNNKVSPYKTKDVLSDEMFKFVNELNNRISTRDNTKGEYIADLSSNGDNKIIVEVSEHYCLAKVDRGLNFFNNKDILTFQKFLKLFYEDSEIILLTLDINDVNVSGMSHEGIHIGDTGLADIRLDGTGKYLMVGISDKGVNFYGN